MDLEHKFARLGGDLTVRETTDDAVLIEGYASVFGRADKGRDMVEKGAYAASLDRLGAKGDKVRMLWQHDPAQPIGVWDAVREDATGLWVSGRILTTITKGREAAALLAAKAIDGLSIGYRTIRARKDDTGLRRLSELELWEVSLVTFPMLPEARVTAKGDDPDAIDLRELAQVFTEARAQLNRA